jgi:two-component system OmpR family sensor kinase
LLNIERKPLIQFVSVFVALNTLFLLTLSILYYYYQKNIYLDIRQNSIRYYADKVNENIYSATSMQDIKDWMIGDPRFDVAILDDKKKVVYTSDKPFPIPITIGMFEYQNHFYDLEPIDMEKLHHYRYLVIRADSIDNELAKTRRSIYIVLIFSIIFMTLVIYTLSKLFLHPLRVYISKLDRFIRDTTHELNTPLSIITMSVERLHEEGPDPKIDKHLGRITVALRTISHLYNDLTFLTLYKKTHIDEQPIDVSLILEERINYFRPLADAKKITFNLNIESTFVKAHSEKLIRIIDNLLSNAIKYNKRSGNITIILTGGLLSVKDTGIGIPEDKLNDIFLRYTRFDDANGGFGIGLNIVHMICQEYHFPITVESHLKEGTIFKIQFHTALI